MKKTKYYSYKKGKLSKGCQYCIKGYKLVLFVTGLCPRRCYYCPISDKKYQKDNVYANEWPIKNIREIIKEAKLINAKGAGFTGGDPLCKLWRTFSYIKKLKKVFGKKFHIHLYTSFDLVNEKTLKKLVALSPDDKQATTFLKYVTRKKRKNQSMIQKRKMRYLSWIFTKGTK